MCAHDAILRIVLQNNFARAEDTGRREIQQGTKVSMLPGKVGNLLSTTPVWSLLARGAAFLIAQNALYATSTATRQRDNTVTQLAPAVPL
jgi:hypothetical protein